jgi:ABC-type multidrug transport system fused ATPase/permease subunit
MKRARGLIWHLIRPEWRFFGLGALASLVLALATPLLPTYVVAPLFSEVLGQNRFEQLPNLILRTAVILIISSLALFAQDAWFGIGAARFGSRVRAQLFRTLLHAEVRLGAISAERAARAALDVRELELFYGAELTAIIGQGLVMIAVAVALFISSPTLTLGLLVLVVPLTLISNWLAKKLERALEHVQRESGRSSGLMSEALAKLEVIKVFRAESQLERTFNDVNVKAEQAMRQRSIFGSMNAPIAQLTAGAGIVALLTLGVLEVRAGRLSVASLTAYLSLLALCIAPIQIFARSFGRLAAIRAPAKALQTAITEPTELETGSLNTAPSGAIGIKGLSVSYPTSEESALNNIALELPKGSFTALIGSSGSGKTTLTKVLLRLLEPSGGQIHIGAQPMTAFTKAAWRSAFAFVPQQPSLFAGTIRQNLSLFSNLGDAQAWAALDQAGLADDVRALPEQLETPLFENGAGLSGGQQQRLSIARALITNAEVLIFDEPTSSLDAATENLIKTTLESLRGSKTLLVIAHRLSTVEHADQVVVLERGSIKTIGTPMQLGIKVAPLHGVELQ